jgi:3-oxoadipate enol-lactonase
MQDLAFFTTGDGCRIAYRLEGAADRPVLVLSNSIGTDLHMWDAQASALAKHYRLLRYDSRGHGASGVPAGAYSTDRLGRDVLELLDALGIGRVHFCGLSLGGMVGQWLGIHAPERIDRLILCNTSSWLGPASQFEERIRAVLNDPGLVRTVPMFLGGWFPRHMLDPESPLVAPIRAMLRATPAQGFAGNYAAVRDMDLRRTVALIAAPTLVIAGRDDTVTALSHSELLAATIPGARLFVLPAVHLSNVEFPVEFLAAVLEFLSA